jgi:hypothetical protein
MLVDSYDILKHSIVHGDDKEPVQAMMSLLRKRNDSHFSDRRLALQSAGPCPDLRNQRQATVFSGKGEWLAGRSDDTCMIFVTIEP